MNCGLLYVKNPPDEQEINEAHRQGLHRGKKTLDVTGTYNPLRISHHLRILNDVFESDLNQKKTWLDIGCGHGEFIEALQQTDDTLKVYGSEPNIHKQESA